ncbi:hypothetical protein ADM90_19080 [Lysinibacillus macroides]|uniref:Uncharacterized protein n=1 Tax=Lysinibacillus macroides TaxID=33935 RepID=A0A0N0CVH7_9BACI|nr:hypothetical protein ADM90_19080 [Lysinibacillus macroides]
MKIQPSSYFSSLEVAEMVGREHKEVLRDIRNVISHLGGQTKIEQSYFIETSYTNSQNKQQPCYQLTKKGCELYATRMTGEKGTQFAVAYIERFNAMERQLKQFPTTPNIEQFEMHLIGMKYSADILRVDEPSKIRMLTDVHKAHGVPTNHLPQYVEEELKKSLTELLKAHDVPLTAAKANTKLIELGLLEIKERPSTKGGLREFKSLTEAGRYYGDNAISPRNPKETQPLYYPSKFSELLKLLI